jgi:hypothetical protein
MERLTNLISEIESKIEFRNLKNVSVSKSDVAWHLDHSLRVINGIFGVIKKSNPDDYKSSFNFKRSLILFLGKIPRGKAKAPETVISVGEISLEDLNSRLETAKTSIKELHNNTAKSNFVHPYFGQLNLKQTIRFLEIHTKHHLNIVDDILKK